MFYSKMTPPGCGPEAAGSINGESGTLLEELLVGGTVTVVRKDSDCDEGDMDMVQDLVLDYHGSLRKLSPWLSIAKFLSLNNDIYLAAVDHCQNFLTSIQTEDLKAFPFSMLRVYVPKKGYSRFKLHDAPDPKPPVLSDGKVNLSRGLGLRITTGGVNVLS